MSIKPEPRTLRAEKLIRELLHVEHYRGLVRDIVSKAKEKGISERTAFAIIKKLREENHGQH